MTDLRDKYEVVIGLEVQLSLKQNQKYLHRIQLSLVMNRTHKSALLL